VAVKDLLLGILVTVIWAASCILSGIAMMFFGERLAFLRQRALQR
jgi:hypothetical protein